MKEMLQWCNSIGVQHVFDIDTFFIVVLPNVYSESI